MASISLSLSKPQPRTAVIIADLVDPRVAKITYGLHASGWRVTLLHRQPLEGAVAGWCENVHPFSSPLEAALLSACYSPSVYHIFSAWNFEAAAFCSRLRPGKLIFDDADVLQGMLRADAITQDLRNKLDLERFCLENADGLCCRSLEIQAAKRCAGVKLKGPTLFFPDLAWGEARPTAWEDDSRGSRRPAAVYCGNLADGKVLASSRYVVQVAESLQRAGFDLHIYPSYDGFVPIPGLPPNTTVHSRLTPDALLPELSRYDMGITMPYVLTHAHSSTYTMDKSLLAMANKVFDYLDAGLPVVCDTRLQSWILGRGRVLIPISRERPLEDMDRIRYEDVRAQREHIRQHRGEINRRFGILSHMPRLLEFYRKVSES